MDDHSLHSPFLFNFYQEIIKDDGKSHFEEIERLRKKLLKSRDVIEIEDLGAGSRMSKSNERTIRQIAKHSSTPARFSRLLARLIVKNQPQTILELGTSLGLNTLYMSQSKPDAQVITFEGSDVIADFAEKSFTELGSSNIQLIKGNIDQTLSEFLLKSDDIDLVYMDANHQYKPTLNYFEQLLPKLNEKSVMIIDDINWSREMERAWKAIKSRDDITLSIDLFEAGLLFFNPDLPKHDLIIKY